MNLLLDTHLLLWAAGQPEKISVAGRRLLENTENALFFSAASFWEVAIKNTLGRKEFRVESRLLRRGLLDNGYGELVVTTEHALATESLPPIHKDPFDRILVAQAQAEGMLLLTSDETVANYPGPVRLV